MKELVPEMDVVIHCMAVSDFAFKPISTKLKSNDPLAFIESMKERIYQTPKILKEIKTWNPNCKLISFKFEVGLTPEELIEVATKSGLDNNCDIVIANDKAQMTKEKKHIAYAIDPHNIENQVILYNKQEIAEFIYNQIK
jgi:phosphopantothenate-cysteine ligase